MALTKITTNIIADNAITSDKIAAGALDSQVSTYLTNNNFATQSYVSTELANLIDSSPEALNTLNELANALGDDPNFATTVNNSIGTKWTQDNTKISNWDTAFSWGNHANAGYLTSYTETDPTVPSHVKSITTTNISNWDTAFSWGNHATQGYATQTYVNNAVSNLVDSSPAALDTLNELANALGDDPNFATTVNNNIAGKLSLSGGTMTGNITLGSNSIGHGVHQQETTLLAGIGSTNGPVWKVRYDGTTANRYVDFGQIDGFGNWSTGLKLYNNQDLIWKTNRFVVKENGRAGIGTDTPRQSLDVKGNIALGGNASQNYIVFSGTTGDGDAAGTEYTTTFIGERIYGGTEKSELIFYKGNDGHNSPASYDRIRSIAAQHKFQAYNVPQTYPTDLNGVGNLPTYDIMTLGEGLGGTWSDTPKIKFEGSRPIAFATDAGNVQIKGSSGGWATGYYFLGNNGTYHGGFGALGGEDAFTNYWIGAAYNDANVFKFYKNGNMGYTGALVNSAKNETPGPNNGAIRLTPSVSGGSTGIVFESAVNANSDYGYIWWYDDNDNYRVNNSTENGCLLLGVQNDYNTTSGDSVAIECPGDIYINPGSYSSTPSPGGGNSWNTSYGDLYVGNAANRKKVWHSGNSSTAWKGGPVAFISANVHSWGFGGDRGDGSLDGTSNANGIVVNETGIYRVTMWQRTTGTADTYIGLSVNGSRSTMENRNGADGLWGHDHQNYTAAWAHSEYVGVINAGEVVGGGAPNSGYANRLTFSSSSGWAGGIIITRIA